MNEDRNVHSRRVGLKDIYVALVTKNDATGYTAGIPTKLARAISAKVSDKFSSEKLYSDDAVEETDKLRGYGDRAGCQRPDPGRKGYAFWPSL